jgi:integrase
MARKADKHIKRKIGKLSALARRPGTTGERQAAIAALERVRARAASDSKDRLTDALVKRLKAPPQGNRIYYDADLPGFGIRTTAGDAKAFILNYRVRGSGRERRYTIGGFPNWGAAAAREKARELKRLIDDGGDPLADLESERAAPTMADLCHRFEQEHLPAKRQGTAADYARILRVHIRPFFGQHTKVSDVQFEDVQRLHRRISAAGHAYRANATLRVLSKMMNLACRWNMRSDNPCKGVERNTEYRRMRYLKRDDLGHELERLTKALREHPNQQAANILRILLLTGARRGEVLAMRWADLDLRAGIWSKPASSVKQNEPHIAPLAAPVLQLLGEIRHEQTRGQHKVGEFVFPGGGDSGHVVAIKKAWRRICQNANISDLRIHDLRHSFASQLASGGASLPLIGALLGHSNPTTTHRYAHLFQDPQRAAVERVGAVITAAGQPAKQPTPLKRRRRR